MPCIIMGLSGHERKETYINLSYDVTQVWVMNKFLCSYPGEYSHDWVILDKYLPRDTIIAEHCLFYS